MVSGGSVEVLRGWRKLDGNSMITLKVYNLLYMTGKVLGLNQTFRGLFLSFEL
jgi:hypothetical protein